MNVFELVGKLVLSGGKEVRSELEGIEGVVERNSVKLKALGAAFTALGAAGLAMVQTNKELNTTLALTGETLGLSRNKMQDLAIATADAGFPLKEVAATLEILARAGMRNTEEIVASAKAFDALGDAVGSSGDQMASILMPAFKSLGVEIPTTSEELDKFTWLTKNTTVNIEDFGAAMQYVAVYGEGLNVTIEDMVGIMAALEAKGITGSAATRKFRTAVTEAKDGTVSLTDALGLTQEEIDGYKDKLEDAAGMTDRYSKAADSQITLMDKLKEKFTEITLKASRFLEPLQPILTAMTALGPVMMFMSTATGVATVKWIAHTAAMVASTVAMGAIKVATVAWTAVQWLLNVALSANPIGIVILAVGALIAIVVLLVKNWDTVTAFFGKLWSGIKAIFWAVVDWMKEWGVLFLGPVGFIIKYWDQIVEFFKKIPERFKSAFSGLIDIILAPFRAVVHGIESAINWLIRAINKIHIKIPWPINKEIGFNISEISLPSFQRGGPIMEDTLLYGLKSQRPYAVAHAGERVTPGGQLVNIFVELDGQVLAQALGQPLVDTIRLRTGVRI